jgi:hypothetical protein
MKRVYLGSNIVWQNAPTAIAATGVGTTSFTANWEAYSGAKYYLLDVSETSDFSTFVYENQIVSAPTTSYVVIGLQSNTTYYYRVRANDEYDPDYQAVLDYATTLSYTLPSASQQPLQNQLVIDLKAAGVWNKLDTFTVFATDAEDSPSSGTSNFALIDWKRLVTHTEINSPNFIPNVGYQGNGTSSSILTSYNPTLNGTNYVLGDGSFGYYMNTYDTAPGTTESAWGQNDNFGAFAWLRYTSKELYFNTDVFTGSFAYVNFVNSNNSFVQINNTSLTGVNIYKNGSLTDSGNLSTTPTAIPNGPFRAFTYRSSQFSDAILSLLYAGGDLTSEASDFNTAVNSYITSI